MAFIALAEGRSAEALDRFVQSDQGSCPVCVLPIGRVDDAIETPTAVISLRRPGIVWIEYRPDARDGPVDGAHRADAGG